MSNVGSVRGVKAGHWRARFGLVLTSYHALEVLQLRVWICKRPVVV